MRKKKDSSSPMSKLDGKTRSRKKERKKINREDEATTESFLVAARRQQAHWTWRLKTASNCCPKTLAGFNFSEADVFVL